MKLKSHVLALAATAAVGIAGVVTQVVVAAPERPAALQALEKQGVTNATTTSVTPAGPRFFWAPA